ncbi:hypothetical protein B0A52_04884 [Exophiala mesophila]|uniref:Xylanolytic transcriptional activator regulatory domain-containing protein n=1 Tax=Exophiala mesophila TaxID=212818 RepID=A0A438N6E3_EXOME|nr:hypothetical protein B0A52_04884 [Exophiala mesophila]
MLDLGNDEAEMDIDAGAFWTSPNPDHVSFNPEDASQMVEMGWASVDFSLTTPQQRSDLQQTGHNLTAPPNLAIPGPESPIRASVDGNSQLQLQGEEARGTYLSSNMHHPAQALSLDSRSRLSNTSPNALPAPMPADMEHLITFPGSDAFDGSPQSSGIGAGSVLGDGLDWPAEFSLDSKPGWSNQVIGLSSESDPFLLRHYLYNVHDTHPMFRLHFRKILDDKDMQTQIEEQSVPVGNVPLQFMMVNEEIWQDGLKSVERIVSGPHTEESDLKLLNEIVPNELGSRLLKLYTQCVHPRFPVLSLSDLSQLLTDDCCIGIKSTVFALAAPFTFLDDELSVSKGYSQLPTENLWAIAYRNYLRLSQFSHLSLLQLSLLLLEMPPLNFAVAESPNPWALSCSALAIAESLGLNIDPLNWRLPRHEIILRRRLWWLTYVQHIWHALVFGRTSHIDDAAWDVSRLSPDDFEGTDHPDPDVKNAIKQHIPTIMAMSDLSTIAADILKQFYTLKAIRQTSSLTSLLDRAKPLRKRMETWMKGQSVLSKATSDLNDDDLEKSAPLRLSHITLEILIYRALLRPLSYGALQSAEQNREPTSFIFENCYACAKVAVEFVAALNAKHFSNYWHPHARYQLCYISTFILMNFAQSATQEAALRNKALLSKWRDSLRSLSRAWPLAKLATMRLDAVFWKGLSAVVHGAGPDNPASRLLKEQGSQTSGQG